MAFMTQPEVYIIFREVQNLRGHIFLISVLYPAVLLWYIEIHSFFFGKPAGVASIPDSYLFGLWVFFGLFFPSILYFTKYITEVREDGVYIRLVPINLSFKKIPFYLVEDCKIQSYASIKGKDKTDPSISRRVNMVVSLKLISGEKMLISSRKPEELCRAIMQAKAQY
jgi:hypothetical protein